MKRTNGSTHHLLHCIAIALLLLTTSACEFHASENGTLDGFWQLAQADTLATGGTTDLRSEQRSWAVQGHLLVIRSNYIPNVGEVIFRFSHEANELVLSEPHLSNRDEGDILITDAEDLQPLGIFHLEEHFRVLQLNSSRMTLESDRLRLHFRRY